MVTCDAIGIDLGTNFVCVGAFRNGAVEIIPNEHDQRLTPAYVAFTDEERLFGDSAKHQAPLNLENTIYNVKRLIGRKYSSTQRNEILGYKIKESPKKTIQIPITRVRDVKEKVDLYPEQISAMILSNTKEVAEAHLKTKVKKAVISVPASFDDAQRTATVNAGKIAGFEEVKLLDETTAAVFAYCFGKEIKEKKILAVVDFGGGSIDISVAEVSKGNIEIVSSDGNCNMGGESIDNDLVQHFTDKLKSQKIDLSKNKKNKFRLKEASEKMKRNLSAASRARFPDDLAADLGVDVSQLTLTREEFDTINKKIFQYFNGTLVEKFFKNTSKYRKDKIDDVILVGGSTRIPKIRTILQEYFQKKDLNRTINPDEAVAFGASIHTANLWADQKIPLPQLRKEGEKKKEEKKQFPKGNNKEIKKMIEENAKFDQHDNALRETNNARNNLEKFIYSVKVDMKSSKMSENDKISIFKKCDELLKWLETAKETTKEDCEKKQKDLDELIKKLTVGKNSEEKADNEKDEKNIVQLKSEGEREEISRPGETRSLQSESKNTQSNNSAASGTVQKTGKENTENGKSNKATTDTTSKNSVENKSQTVAKKIDNNMAQSDESDAKNRTLNKTSKIEESKSFPGDSRSDGNEIKHTEPDNSSDVEKIQQTQNNIAKSEGNDAINMESKNSSRAETKQETDSNKSKSDVKKPSETVIEAKEEKKNSEKEVPTKTLPNEDAEESRQIENANQKIQNSYQAAPTGPVIKSFPFLENTDSHTNTSTSSTANNSPQKSDNKGKASQGAKAPRQTNRKTVSSNNSSRPLSIRGNPAAYKSGNKTKANGNSGTRL